MEAGSEKQKAESHNYWSWAIRNLDGISDPEAHEGAYSYCRSNASRVLTWRLERRTCYLREKPRHRRNLVRKQVSWVRETKPSFKKRNLILTHPLAVPVIYLVMRIPSTSR